MASFGNGWLIDSQKYDMAITIGFTGWPRPLVRDGRAAVSMPRTRACRRDICDIPGLVDKQWQNKAQQC